MKVFEGTASPGHIKINSVIKALTTYGSEQLTEEQAQDLVSQVNGDPLKAPIPLAHFSLAQTERLAFRVSPGDASKQQNLIACLLTCGYESGEITCACFGGTTEHKFLALLDYDFALVGSSPLQPKAAGYPGKPPTGNRPFVRGNQSLLQSSAYRVKYATCLRDGITLRHLKLYTSSSKITVLPAPWTARTRSQRHS